MKLLLSVFALLFSTFTLADTEITFHEGGNGLYVVEVSSDDDNLNAQAGLKIIANESVKKCGNKQSQLGKYRFKKTERVDASEKSSFRMVQQLFCGDLPTEDNNQKPTPSLSKSQKETLKAKATKLTNSYLDALTDADFEKAYSFFTKNQKQNQPYQAFYARQSQLPSKGKKIKETVWNTTIYIDPPNSPQKGIFVATDFEREYANVPIYCGYLVWYLEDNALKLMREDIGVMDRAQFIKIKLADIERIKASFRCQPKQ